MDTAVGELAEWSATELPQAKFDTVFLRKFLLGCKCRGEVARTKLRNYVGLRTRASQWFTDRDPFNPQVEQLLNQGVFHPLPRKEDGGPTIIYIRATQHNPRTTSIDDVFKTSLMVLDAAFEEDINIAQKGVAVIVDLIGVEMRHAWQMTPTVIKNAVHSWQDCYPIRIKSMHFINSPLHVDVVLKLIKQCMRPKLRDRVHCIRRDLRELHQDIHPEFLPQEIEGTLGPLQPITQHWKRVVTNKRNWFLSKAAD